MWTDEDIHKALQEIKTRLGKHPSATILRKENKDLARAIENHPLKNNGWRKRLGSPVQREWNDALIQQELQQQVERLGRMPTVSDLCANNLGDLANAVRRSGGFYEWADRLGAEQKKSETWRSYQKELWVKAQLESLGHKVEMTPVKCEYDLLVDEKHKVEVKLAKYSDSSGGYVFSFGKKPSEREIDIAVLICVDENDENESVYLLPEEFCNQQTITITKSKRWVPFKERWHSF